ncbi:MAG TPA: ABC transporter permease [Solirubrobacteraceae bacterium]|nr:ABC transporter permease [Solirubrobacteraceae bacterium]
MSIADSRVAPGLSPAEAGEGQAEAAPASGLSPWALALRRLRRNRPALIFGAVFVVLVALALVAPLWAQVADTTPARNHLSDTIVVDGRSEQVVSFDGVPIGPTWQKKFFLGADTNGRDVAVRLLYGARNSLFIGITASLITVFLAVLLGMLAGYFRGWTDAVISRSLDVMWAFPVLLLGVALGVSLALGGLKIGPLEIHGGSLWIPTLIIGVVTVVYLARPIRGQVLSLREKEFVEAARAQGAGPIRIMFGELLPNVASTILVFFPLIVAHAILLEAALSFLGAGVQPPEPSWGTMLSDGVVLLSTSPHLTIVPGLMLVLTVLALNVFGEGVRDALDPRAKVRLEL